MGKSKYTTPTIEAINMDNEISMVMASEGSPGDKPQAAPPPPSSMQSSSFQDNPFEAQ